MGLTCKQKFMLGFGKGLEIRHQSLGLYINPDASSVLFKATCKENSQHRSCDNSAVHCAHGKPRPGAILHVHAGCIQIRTNATMLKAFTLSIWRGTTDGFMQCLMPSTSAHKGSPDVLTHMHFGDFVRNWHRCGEESRLGWEVHKKSKCQYHLFWLQSLEQVHVGTRPAH